MAGPRRSLGVVYRGSAFGDAATYTKIGDAAGTLSTKYNDDAGIGGLLISDIIALGESLLDAVMQGLKTVIVEIIEMIRGAVSDIKAMLNFELPIPIVKLFYENKTDEKLTALNLVCLIAAVPATVIYKAFHDNAPPFSQAQVEEIVRPHFFPWGHTLRTVGIVAWGQDQNSIAGTQGSPLTDQNINRRGIYNSTSDAMIFVAGVVSVPVSMLSYGSDIATLNGVNALPVDILAAIGQGIVQGLCVPFIWSSEVDSSDVAAFLFYVGTCIPVVADLASLPIYGSMVRGVRKDMPADLIPLLLQKMGLRKAPSPSEITDASTNITAEASAEGENIAAPAIEAATAAGNPTLPAAGSIVDSFFGLAGIVGGIVLSIGFEMDAKIKAADGSIKNKYTPWDMIYNPICLAGRLPKIFCFGKMPEVLSYGTQVAILTGADVVFDIAATTVTIGQAFD